MSEPTAPAATEAPATAEPTGSVATAPENPNQEGPAPHPAAGASGAGVAEPDPEQLAMQKLAGHLGMDKNAVTPSAVLSLLEAFKESAANTVAALEQELRAAPSKLEEKAKAAFLHIKGRAQNGSAPDQDFVRTHGL